MAPAREPRPSRHLARDPSLKAKHREVGGLEWASFEGVDVLRMAGASTNHVACPSVSRPGTFEIYRVEPREIVVRRIPTKDVLRQIESLIRQDEETAERATRWQREKEEKEREGDRKREHQPGFYILPGEEDPENPEKIPLGPFWRFEAAGSRYSPEDLDYDRFGDEDVEDWAREQLAGERKKPASERQAISIVESRNAREAAEGKGHVWWQDGTFRGPPVDPRQAGWGW